ncbi:carboxypeptidase regulatory-like domain-containing protein [Candidatus Palauibacter sp.]|uniref:carboxypeptidase regulatory-like domain-containing protein n=1 Tax=Candidatus Palauibacter sp. TaxID=3101350 RepID=UPI003AF29B35
MSHHSFLARRIIVRRIVAIFGLGAGAGDLAAQEPDCDERAALGVIVLDESGATPVPNATVIVRWTDTDRVRRPVREEVGAGGRLVLCAPRDTRQATLWAEFGDASSEEAVVVVVAGLAHEVELALRSGPVRTGRLIGQVRDARTDDPVTAAAVSVPGREEVAETNRRGRFVMSGVPAGMQELNVRHLGYAPLSYVVEVSPGLTTEIEIGLVPDPVEMEPIVATALRLRRLEIKGFYERKYWGELVGTGIFYTADDIDRRRPVEISHMIADESGIRLECNLRRTDCRLVNTRLSSPVTGDCPLSYFVDGMPARGMKLDDFVRPVEIAGLEIYKGLASGPAEFPSSRCGMVVVWTR